MTDLDACMAFWRIASRHGVIVDVGVVNGAIGVDRDRRIGALDLRGAARDDELLPSYASICAQCAALVASAVTDWQPDGTVWRNMDMAMQTVTLRDAVAFVGQDPGAVTCAEGVAALAGSRTERP